MRLYVYIKYVFLFFLNVFSTWITATPFYTSMELIPGAEIVLRVLWFMSNSTHCWKKFKNLTFSFENNWFKVNHVCKSGQGWARGAVTLLLPGGWHGDKLLNPNSCFSLRLCHFLVLAVMSSLISVLRDLFSITPHRVQPLIPVKWRNCFLQSLSLSWLIIQTLHEGVKGKTIL